MRKWITAITVMCMLVTLFVPAVEASAAGPVVTVQLDGSKTEYHIGDTIRLNIHFNAKVHMADGVIRAEAPGYGQPYVFHVIGAAPGEYKTDYKAEMLVHSGLMSGELIMGNLEGVAVLEGGLEYYDSAKHTVSFGASFPRLTIDTMELEWDTRVWLNDAELTSGTGGATAKQGDVIRIRLFSLNVGNRAPNDFGSELTLELNGGAYYATYQGMELIDAARNRYAYDYAFTVPDRDLGILDVTAVSGVGSGPTHNGKPISLVIPDEVASVSDYQLWVDGARPNLHATPNGTPNEIIVTTDDTSADLYYLWWQPPTSIYENPFVYPEHIQGVGAGWGHPIPLEGIDGTGDYYLYIRAVDHAGNETVNKFGPYYLNFDTPDMHITPNANRYGGGEDPQFTVHASTVPSVTYTWNGLSPTVLELEDGSATFGGLPPISGIHELTVTAPDTTVTYSYVRDLEAPTVTTSVYQDEAGVPKQRHEVSITVLAVEDDLSALGDSYMAFQYWSESITPPSVHDIGWQELTLDGFGRAIASSPPAITGDRYLHILAQDAVGNTIIHTVEDESGQPALFRLDNTPPELSLGGELIACSSVVDGDFVSLDCSAAATVHDESIRSIVFPLTVTDDSEYTVEYLTDDEPELAYTKKFPASRWETADSGSIELGDPLTGTYYLIVYVEDEAGNAKLFMTHGYQFDNRSAYGVIRIVPDYVNTSSIDFDYWAYESGELVDGDIGIRYSFDNVTWTELGHMPNESRAIAVLPEDAGDGEYTLYVRFVDAIGNESDVLTDTVVYDRTPPVATDVTLTPPSLTTGPVEVTVTYTDDNPLIMNEWTNTYSENGTYQAVFQDQAGNVTYHPITISNIDRVGPVVQWTVRGNLEPQQTAETSILTTEEDLQSLAYTWTNDADLVPQEIDQDGMGLDWIPEWESVALGETIALDPTEKSGAWYVWIRAEDERGNLTIERSDPFIIDRNPPITYITYTPTPPEQQLPGSVNAVPGPVRATIHGLHDQPYDLDLSFGSEFTVTQIVREQDGTEEPLYGGVGCPEYGEQDGCPRELTYIDNTDAIYHFHVEDAVGNTAIASTEPITWIDHTLPAADVIFTPDVWTGDHVDVTLRVEESSGELSLKNIIATQRDTFSPAQWIKVITRDESGELTEWTGDELTGAPDWSAYQLIEVVMRFTEDVPFNLDDGEITYTVERCNVDGDCIEQIYSRTFNLIDRTAPTAKLIYSQPSGQPTHRDVTVRVFPQDGQSDVTVTSAGGAEHTFTDNGEFTFTFVDQAGNVGSMTAVVDYIAKDTFEPSISYSTTAWTNESVTAIIDFDDQDTGQLVQINGSSEWVSTYETAFVENGTREISYVDQSGRTGTVTLHVDWIDKLAPTGTISYDPAPPSPTAGVVTATVVATDNSGIPPVYTDKFGNPLPDGHRHTFTENGQHVFYFQDAAGNIGSATAVVNHISTGELDLRVEYSTLEPTNGAVRATLKANMPIEVMNDAGDYTTETYYDFTDNGNYTFNVRDQLGRVDSITAVVTNIDKTPPVPTLSFQMIDDEGNLVDVAATRTDIDLSGDRPTYYYVLDGTDETKDDVFVTMTADEPVRVLNNAGRSAYRFTDNGSFRFILEDTAGNTVEAVATVTVIDKSTVSYTLEYSETAPTQDPVTVIVVPDPDGRELSILNNGGSKSITFTRNGVQWLQAQDELGNTYLIEIRVTNIDHTPPTIGYPGPLIIALGAEADMLAGVTATDDTDGDVLAHVTVSDDINRDVPGTYEIRYTVTDSASNRTEVIRQAIVVGTEELAVYINGMAAVDDLSIRAHTLTLRIFGAQGDTAVYWAEGRRSKGYFKESGIPLADPQLEIERQGYYTLFIQDQERHYKLIHIYVIPATDKGGITDE